MAAFVAGLLALGGAIIAYSAANRTIKANAKKVQDQIGANNKAVQDQIAANAKIMQDQIAANAKAVQGQIAAAAVEQQKDREADWAIMRRKELLDLLEEAGRIARKLASAAIGYRLVGENPELFDSPDDQRRQKIRDWEFPEITTNARIVVDRLKLHGLTTVSGPLGHRQVV